MSRWSTPGEAYAYETGYIEGRADAVKRGHWINLKISTSGNSSAECSLCGAVVHDSFTNSKAIHYCPNCGAKMSEDNATQYTECVVNLYTETKLRFVLDKCIEDEELIEKILKALDGDEE